MMRHRIDSKALERYVEDLAVFFERSGLPRIAGRILALLLVCDPPHRAASDFVEELGVSKASVSNMLRLLETVGLIERVGVPGERASHYSLAKDGFEKKFEMSTRALVGFSPLAARGFALLAPAGDARKARLREMAALYAFWEREMPKLLERWRRERTALVAAIESELKEST